MTGRERVKATLSHKGADRLPVGHMPFYPAVADMICAHAGLSTYEEALVYIGSDYRRIVMPMRQTPGPALLAYYRQTYQREWPVQDIAKPVFEMPTFGVEAHGSYSTAITVRPFESAETTAEIDDFPWPDPGWYDYDGLAAEVAKHPDKANIVSHWSPIYGSVCQLFGMEAALMNMLLQPELVEAAIEHITDFFYERNRRMFERCKGQLDIFIIGDDVASQSGLMISLDVWRRFFKKPLQKLITLAKSYGLFVHEHCCGAMSELIPEFIALGVDELEPCQFHLPGMEPKRLKREYGNDITFYGGVCTQSTLPFGSPEDVRGEVRRLQKIFGDTGLAIGSDHSLLPEFPLENILALYEEAVKG